MDQANAFPVYTQIKPKVPRLFWWLLRILTLVATLSIVYLLVALPETGLVLTWQILIPLLPVSFAVMPGLWRNICPMAFLNQLPRSLGFSREHTLPDNWRKFALYISVLIFLIFILCRQPVLNHNGLVLAIVLATALVLAFVGGVIFKGRSGWCGTFCPLAPIQKAYGHAPILLVRNGYCETCLGCQKNCYDFNPRAAFFSDISDPDTSWSEHRRFFLAMLPGLIVGFFNTSFSVESGFVDYLQSILIPPVISAGIFYSAHNLLHIRFFKLASLFAMTALAIFYWYAVPVMTSGVFKLTGLQLPEITIQSIQALVLIICLAVLVRSFISERLFKLAQQSSARASIGKGVEVLKSAMRQTTSMVAVQERASGQQILVSSGQTLLDAIEASELPIMAGCRMGMCGSDPVVIVDGHENLDLPDENELNTLRRLGLEGKARLACCCRPKAGISIDLDADPTQFTMPGDATNTQIEEDVDRQRIIIIGNGIAGVSTAESLREQNTDCKIIMISNEAFHFYNRMGLESVLYGRTAIQGLYLVKEDWYKVNKVETWLNTSVAKIDAKAHTLTLGTGETVGYNQLVIATGASAVIPDLPCYQLPGVFGLRSAEDALAIRQWVQDKNARQAVVLGGGVLGIEAAEALLQLGLKVTIVHRAEHLMNRQLDLQAATILKTFLSNKGMRILTGTSIDNVKESDSLKQIQLSDGRQLITDVLLLCLGVKSNSAIAETAGLEINRGIVVDEQMRTSADDIYCVGDAADLPGAVGGLWGVASEQGKVAAIAILGGEKRYAADSLPPVQLKVSGIDLKSFGTLGIDPDCRSYAFGDSSKHNWKHMSLKKGLLKGGVFVNAPLGAMAAINALKKNQTLRHDEVETMLSKDDRQGNQS